MDVFYSKDASVGSSLSIKVPAINIADLVGYQGITVFDSNKTDGTMKKLLNFSKLESLVKKTS